MYLEIETIVSGSARLIANAIIFYFAERNRILWISSTGEGKYEPAQPSIP